MSLPTPFNRNAFIADPIEYPLKKQWAVKAPKGGFSHEAAMNGVIYAAIGMRKGIVAIDAATGEYRWQKLKDYYHDCMGLWAVPPHHLMAMEVYRNDRYLQRIDALTGEPTGHRWDCGSVFGMHNGRLAFGMSCSDPERGGGDTLNLIKPENPDDHMTALWAGLNGNRNPIPGDQDWLIRYSPKDKPGPGWHSAAIDPLTAEIKHTFYGVPLSSAAGYWVLGPSSDGDEPISVAEQATGKVLWDLGFHDQPHFDRPDPIGGSMARSQCMRFAIHPEHGYFVVLLERRDRQPGYTLECYDLPTGEQKWVAPLDAVWSRSYGPIQFMIITGDTIWTSERLPVGPQDIIQPKTKPTLTARDVHTGEILWKKAETGLSALVIDGRLILSTGTQMKCLA